MLKIKNYTYDLSREDKGWWKQRAFILCSEQGREIAPKSLEYRMWLRRN